MKFFVMLVLALVPEVGFTSKEGVLPTTSFRIESTGIESSGQVFVEGRRNSKGNFEYISVVAFGKKILFEKDLLGKIPDSSNGVQLSYELGYKHLGGKTIYLVFLKGFTSGSKDKVIFSVNEEGKVNLVQ